MKHYTKKIAKISLIILLLIALTGCGKLFSGEDNEANGGGSSAGKKLTSEELDNLSEEEYVDVINNGIEFEEEEEGAEKNLHFRKSDELEYLGSWEATSGHAIYMYGVLELNILPAGKWTGTIVDEKMTGSWKFEDNKMTLTGDYFNATLSFTDDGKLVMQEDRGEEEQDIVTTVLTKKK